MPPRKKATGPAKGPATARKPVLKEKPPTWSQEAWEAHRARCKIVTADRKRRRQDQEAADAAAATAAMMPSLSIGGYGNSQGSYAAAGFSSQTSASFYNERCPSTPLS